MVISENPQPTADVFEKVLKQALSLAMEMSDSKPDYFISRSPTDFEDDVLNLLLDAASETPFQESFKKISGHTFPDIIAENHIYGVEVKATKSSKWKSIGNSVLESTRVDRIDRIYLFFGQLINPANFRCRLYQDCIYEVAVTHSPRYLIDMDLNGQETLFRKMKIDYNDLRSLERPIEKIVGYYKEMASPGDEPWWMGGAEEASPALIKLWSNLDTVKKNEYILKSVARFPEIFSTKPSKYSRVATWLASRHSVVSTSLRDSFTAGGKVDIPLKTRIYKRLPRVFELLAERISEILEEVKALSVEEVRRFLDSDCSEYISEEEKISLWVTKVIQFSKSNLKKDGNEEFIWEILNERIPQASKPTFVSEHCNNLHDESV